MKPSSPSSTNAEQLRLQKAREKNVPWKKWGEHKGVLAGPHYIWLKNP